MTRTRAGYLLATLLATACGGERCLWYDYAPPSAQLKLRDSATGDLICEADAETNRGPAIAHVDLCEYWIPIWFPDSDSGPEVTLEVEGYEPEVITFPVSTDECDDIERPPLQEITLTPVGEEPEPDGGGPDEDAGAPDSGAADGGDAGDAGAAEAGTDASDASVEAGSDASAATDASVDAATDAAGGG